MALSGKDTGGSQVFLTLSPQPHLDGGYTVVGRLREESRGVLESLRRGDVLVTAATLPAARDRLARAAR
jgi:cyclophilin family peptidyl-prolyl cis-trans isomerase